MALCSLGAFILSAFLPSTGPTSPILGQWESAERSAGGRGEIVEFRPDGSFLQMVAAMGDATFEVRGDGLLTFWKDNATGKTFVIENRIDFEGDVLLQKDDQGNLLDSLQRIARGRGSDPPLVGKWCSESLPGVATLREFTRDGKMFIRLLITAAHGRFRISGDTLTTDSDRSPSRTFRFRVENDLLTVIPAGSPEKKFKRAETTLLQDMP
ncbi:MAG: hypothetical protein ACRD1P_13580 [Thermoanaerobaculia bacterium]